MAKNVNTPEFRASFPALLKAEINKLNGKNEFTVTALFPKGADLSVLKAAAKDVMAEKFGPDSTKWPTLANNPFKDQGERTVKNKDGTVLVGPDGKPVLQPGCEAGAIYMTFKSNETLPPGVVDANVQDIINPAEIYNGMYGRASVRAFYYPKVPTPGIKPGISFGLQNFQKTRDGEPLGGGRTKPAQDFSKVDSPVSADGGPATDPFA